MPKRRSFTSPGCDARSLGVLSQAIEQGTLIANDLDGAEKLLSDTLPSFNRLPKLAKASLAKRALGLVNGKQNGREVDEDKEGDSVEFEPGSKMEITGEEKAEEFGSQMTEVYNGQLNNMLPYNNKQPSTQSPVRTTDDKDQGPRKKRPVGSRKRAYNASSVDGGGGEMPSSLVKRPSVRYADVGGIHHILREVRELIELPLLHVELYKHLGVDPPRGVLLHGPPGCGKTLLANAIAGEIGVPFLKISAPEIVSGMSGESERRLRNLIEEGKQLAPCIIFIDEVDAICSRRESSHKDMERRIVSQLLTCLDDLGLDKTDGKPVIVIGATNRADALDPALRRAGRFDRELELGAPDEEGRKQIITSLSRKLKLARDIDFELIARRTAGFVGADLSSLTTMASTVAVRRIDRKLLRNRVDDVESENAEQRKPSLSPEELESLCVIMDDFLEAVSKVQPSALREGFTTVPDVTWDDVGALDELRNELNTAVVEPIRHPEKFIALGLLAPAGVLLYGPPGCGKTLLAKAVARESGANFISVKGPELLNKFVGESERSVRNLFQRARASSPCVVFFDELDALAPRRSATGESGDSSSTQRVVNQLLTELDGVDGRKQVFVIAATNRPDIIDPAMLRPGRLDKLLYVPLPGKEERIAILRTLSSKTPLDGLVDVREIAASAKCEGFSGADLAALVREAAICALRDSRVLVTTADFKMALHTVYPSVSHRDAKLYRDLKGNLRKTRIHAEDAPTTPDPEPIAATTSPPAAPPTTE